MAEPDALRIGDEAEFVHDVAEPVMGELVDAGSSRTVPIE